MKDNWFKYVFLVVLVVGAVLGYRYYASKHNNKNQDQSNQQQVVEDSDKIKDLRLGISNFDSVNPLITRNKEIINLNKLVYEPLVKIDQDYKLQMCLATEVSKSGDRVYLVKLRQGVKWSDGQLFTAEDVKFTLLKLKERSTMYDSNVERFTSIEVVDDYTCKIRLTEDTEFFLYNLTFPIMPSHQYVDQDFYASANTPVGTGMFKVTHVESSQLVLEKNESYHLINEQNAVLQTITVNIYSEMGEVYNAFKNGNIDLFNTSNNNYTDYIGTIGFNVAEYKGRDYDFLSLNCEDKVLSSKEVRQAIGFAIDKDAIITNIFNNKAYTASYMLDYGSYLNKENTVSSGYNPEQAKKLLETAGWENQYNKWYKQGQLLSLNLTYTSDNNTRADVAKLIQQQLGDIGITVYLNAVSNDSYRKILDNKRYDMLLTGITNSVNPTIKKYYSSEGNLANYRSEKMTAYINETKFISNATTLQEKFNDIQSQALEDSPYIGLYRNKNVIVYSQKLKGELKPNAYNHYYGIENWYRVQ